MSNPQHVERRYRRRWLIAGAAFAVVILLILAIFVLPTYAARWYLQSTLEDAGLQATGVETVEIDLWNREVWFGPVSIGVAGSEPARLERFGLAFSLSRLFDRQGLGKEIVIDGVVLDIARDADGRIAINGVDLFSLLPSRTTDEPEESEEPGKSWGVGANEFTLRNSRARFSQPAGGELVVDIDTLALQGFRTWTPDTPGQFAVSARLNEIGIELGGEAKPFAEEIALQFSSRLSAIELQKIERFTGPLGLAQGTGALHADLNHTVVIAPDGRIDLTSQGQLRADELSVTLPDGPTLDIEKVAVTLDTAEVIGPDGGGSLTGTIAFEGARIHVALADLSGIDLGASALRLSDIDLSVTPALAASGGMTVQLDTADGAADINGLEAEFAAVAFKTTLSGATEDRLAAARANGAMSVNGTGLALRIAPKDGPALSVRTQSLALDASRFEATQDGPAAVSWRVAFGLEASGAETTLALPEGIDASPTELTASLGALSVSGASMTSADLAVAAKRAVLSTFALAMGDGKPLDVQFAELALSEPRWNPQPASGKPDDATAAFRLADGTLAGLVVSASTRLLADREAGTASAAVAKPADAAGPVAANEAEKAETAETAEAAETAETAPPAPVALPLALRIERFAISDPARITLIDARQSPTATLNIGIERLVLDSLDSTDPKARPGIDLAATINDFSTLAADGWLNPFGDRPNFDLTTTLKNLELPAFSRYAAEFLGVNLETGRLGLRAAGEMVEGVLDLSTEIEVRKLRFSPLSPEDAARLSATAGVPVETAVGLLEDSDGLIELSIPIKGDIDNPQFELDQVINKAIGNAITGAIATTIKVIFPPALLISAINSADGEAGVKLAPAEFEAGTTTLKPQGQDLVEALGTLLKERPRLTVSVCGRATSADLQTLLGAEIDKLLPQKLQAYERDMATYRARLQPFIQRGVVDETGKLLVDTPPDTLPEAPAQAKPDRQSVADELARQQQDAHRDDLVALATQRTRTVRVMLSERLGTESTQVAECRPAYDATDREPPRVIVDF